MKRHTIATLDGIFERDPATGLYQPYEPETRWRLSWLLYGWPAFTALILGASIALAVWLG